MDNTVGSLTQLQRSVIIGSILGDGYLRTFPGRKNAFLEVNHSYRQKDYVDWKYNVLKNVSASPPKLRKGNGQRIAYRFHSKQLSELSEFHRQFYGKGRKTIPTGIILNPIALAVWYMDDGSRCNDENYYLNTQQYSIEDQNILMAMLADLGLNTSLNRDKCYWRIRFRVASLSLFEEIVTPYIIPSMSYKLGITP